MPIHTFQVPGEATRREYAIYAAIARPRRKGKVLVQTGNTGDFKRNCNPVLCWAGNHFSHNVIHAHKTIKITTTPEAYDYEFFWTVFDLWKDDDKGRERVELVNEMERELNRRLQVLFSESKKAELANPHAGTGNIMKAEKLRRISFHNKKRLDMVQELVDRLVKEIG